MFVFSRETRRTTFLLIHCDKVYENAVFQFRFSWWTTIKERSTGAYKNYCGAALLNISASINCSTFVNILYARCVVCWVLWWAAVCEQWVLCTEGRVGEKFIESKPLVELQIFQASYWRTVTNLASLLPSDEPLWLRGVQVPFCTC